jgi:class 3 adenylate cyclase
MAGHPPSGTVTFLLTHLEGSTRLWERDPEAMKAAMARQDEILEKTIAARG